MIRRFRLAEPGPLVANERAAPRLSDDQLLVAVEAAVWGAPERALAAGRDIVPCGGAVGRVVDTGSGGLHLAGQRVLVPPEQGCGECDVCRRGGVWACPRGVVLGRTADGSLASHVVCRARWACSLDGVGGPEAALLAREAAWAYAMYASAGVAPGQPVVVVGAGVIARFLVDIAAAKGTRVVVVTGARAREQPAGESEPGEHVSLAAWTPDRMPAWVRDRGGAVVDAASAGAGETRAARAALLSDAVREAGATLGHGDRPRFVFETEADPDGRDRALALAGPCARVVLLARAALGDSDEGEPLGVGRLLAGGGSLLAFAGAHPDLLPEVAALAAAGELDLAGVARPVTAAQMTWALARSDHTLLIAPGDPGPPRDPGEPPRDSPDGPPDDDDPAGSIAGQAV